MSTTAFSIAQTIAQNLNVKTQQVEAAISLLDDGATVPFIARYRKEQTGALDDTQLRALDEQLRYLRELEERRETILNSIESQGKLSEDLARAIRSAETKALLEDLYLPFKPKRRTKGAIAREAGLEGLANALYDAPETDPETAATAFLNPEHNINDTKAALDGAKQILMERFSEDAGLLQKLRSFLWDNASLKSELIEGEKQNGQKFRDYFDYCEAIKDIPSHRALALFRGRNDGVLGLSLIVKRWEDSDKKTLHPCELMVAEQWSIENKGRPADAWLAEVVRWTWKIKLHLHLETELMGWLRDAAELGAIDVFAQNLKDLLLAAPAGAKTTMGLDPGLRTGVKVAIVDATGKLLDHTTIYPHPPQKQWSESLAVLATLAQKHQVALVSIGNGTASRETEKLVSELSKQHPEMPLSRIVVSEAGASVYSASEFAAKEFPDLDVTIRGAVSIARRLQDPLAELVKIEPKAIGVGQYQHDVSQIKLNRSLNAVVEDCVNAVGVDLNTASAALLARVSGLNGSVAANIVDWRDQHGAFATREQLKQVPRLGEKAFEQCAGFLRIRSGENPLDASAVHPESYPVVNKIADITQCSIEELIGNREQLKAVAANDSLYKEVGRHTIEDILSELAKPGRDPRPEFRFASFQEGIERISDLKPGMVLEGSVTNVTNFGAFVDVGVHQDGLVHISVMADRFVKDPRDIVKAGDIVKVKVVEVDEQRKRIALSMKMDVVVSETGTKTSGAKKDDSKQNRQGKRATGKNTALSGAMASAFEKLKSN